LWLIKLYTKKKFRSQQRSIFKKLPRLNRVSKSCSGIARKKKKTVDNSYRYEHGNGILGSKIDRCGVTFFFDSL
jgi:hypothetical protein